MKPCPFCGETEIEVQTGTPDREGIPTNMICTGCGATGPWAYEEQDVHVKAEQLWDRRQP